MPSLREVRGPAHRQTRDGSESRHLHGVEIAILFLDIGRPLSDLTTSLSYPDLHENARETLETLRPSEKQIQSNDDRWFSVRIMPYRRLDNRISGVVITLFDITATKHLEAQLRVSSAK